MNIWDKCSTIKLIIVEQLSQLFLRSGPRRFGNARLLGAGLTLIPAHEHLGQMFYNLIIVEHCLNSRFRRLAWDHCGNADCLGDAAHEHLGQMFYTHPS